MEQIRKSCEFAINKVSNCIGAIAAVAAVGLHFDASDSSPSSGEVIECDSDCSQCCSENQSISMNSSSRYSCSNGESGEGERCRNPKHSHCKLNKNQSQIS